MTQVDPPDFHREAHTSLLSRKLPYAFDAMADFRLAVSPLIAQGFRFAQSVLAANRLPVGQHTALLQAAEVIGKRLGLLSCLFRDDVLPSVLCSSSASISRPIGRGSMRLMN